MNDCTGGSDRAYLSVIDRIRKDPLLKNYIVYPQSPPRVFRGTGPIKLIIVGQDPTVKSEKSRLSITTVLNLNRNKGALYKYLNSIVQNLGMDFEKNVYATNYFKNFFTMPPTQIEDLDIFHKVKKYWLPMLLKEITQFPGIPIISLGEPILKVLVRNVKNRKMRFYWGYESSKIPGNPDKFSHISSENCYLNRVVFPFPHQPGWSKIRFYQMTLPNYTNYMRRKL